MFSTNLSDFYKNESCPASVELLAYQNGEIESIPAGEIREHLSACEFCSAELEFYSHYPQTEIAAEPAEAEQIPAPLYELAEALLKNRYSGATSLNSLLNERKGLVVDKA